MYIPGELLILFIPVIVGLLTGNVVWDGNQFTLKEEKPSREAGLKKIDGNYIISKGRGKINDWSYSR